MKLTENKAVGLLSVLLAAVMWGTLGSMARWLNTFGFSSHSLIFFRSAVTALALGVYMLVGDRSLFCVKRQDVWMFIGSGVVSFFFFNMCYMTSIGLNSLAVSAILEYTSPVFVMLFSVLFFGERISPRKIAALAAAVAGCALVSLTGEVKISALGLAVGLGSGVGYALYSVFGTVALKKYDTITFTFYTFLFSSIASVSVADFSHCVPAMAERPSGVFALIGFCIWSTLLPYILYAAGMRITGATVASIVSCAEPVVAALMGFLLFSERLGPLALLGVAAVLGAIMILELPAKKR